MRELIARFVDWFRRDRLDRELQEELRFHQQQILSENRAENIGSDSAAAAKRRLGNLTQTREAARERWSIPWIDHVQQDTRYAMRGLIRNPMFTAVVVTTLALGLGVNAAVFSLLDRLFLQLPSAVALPNELRRVYVTKQYSDITSDVADRYNYPEWQDLKAASGNTRIAAYAVDSTVLGEPNKGRRIDAAYVSGGYWSLLGVSPSQGRAFTEEESRIEVPNNLVVVSHHFWKRELGGSPNAVGANVRIAGRNYSVVGIAPEPFSGPDVEAIDVWMPLGSLPMDEGDPGRYWYHVRGVRRLRVLMRLPEPGIENEINRRLTNAYREGAVAGGYPGDSVAVVKVGHILRARGPLPDDKSVLIAGRMAMVSALILIIACANVTNLLLTRAIERKREIAMRLALGVSLPRLSLQFITETLLLGGISAAVAIVVGTWTGGALRHWLMPGARFATELFDTRLLLSVVVVTVLLSCIVALFPLLHVRHLQGKDVLNSGSRISSANSVLRSMLTVSQTAFAVVLLIGAVLCIRSFQHVLAVKIGFDMDRVAFVRPIPFGERGGQSGARRRETGVALNNVVERLRFFPGVEGVALSSHPPLGGMSMIAMRISGSDSLPMLDGFPPVFRDVTADYAKVVGLTPRRGRFFSANDVSGAPPVIVVNETMANHLWKGRDPIGECVFVFVGDVPCRTVVGVVADTRDGLVGDKRSMQAYLPLSQGSKTGTALIPTAIAVRATPDQLPNVVRELRRALNVELPNASIAVQTLEERIEPQYQPWRLGALLFSGLGALGLVVAACGLFGVLAYGVRQRLPEMGVRMALGAQSQDILRLVVAQGVRLSAIGVAVGIALAVAGSRFIQPLLFQQGARDVGVYTVVAVIMIATAILATLVPAFRAANADPNSILRAD